MGGMGLTGEGVAVIHVSDINNHAPQFSPVSVSLTQPYKKFSVLNDIMLTSFICYEIRCFTVISLLRPVFCVCMQYSMTAVENRQDYEIGRVNVTDRDDRGTRNWEAKYFISNDLDGNFAIATDPVSNQGVLSVVKVQSAGGECEGGVGIIVSYPSHI